MNILMVLTFTILLGLIVIGLPITVFVVGYKKKWMWKYRVMSLIPLFAALIIAYFQFRTPESFYIEEYSVITKSEFPESGKIQCSTVSSRAFNGDYTSAFIVELEQEDFQSLDSIVTQLEFEEGFNTFPAELEYLETKFGTKKYLKQFIHETDQNETQMVGFLDDKKTIVLVRIVF